MDQQRNRHNEKGAVPFRSGRFYSVDSNWWLAIRRGDDQGPFRTKAVAKQALIQYLNDHFNFEKNLKTDQALQTRLRV